MRALKTMPGREPSRSGAPQDADREVTALYLTHYRPLVRIAALLVQDLAAAEEIIAAAAAAGVGSPSLTVSSSWASPSRHATSRRWPSAEIGGMRAATTCATAASSGALNGASIDAT